MTSAYNIKVSGEVANVLHFEEDLQDRDIQVLLWWEKASYQIDDVTIEKRSPILGVKAISFKEWMGQNMTPTQVVENAEPVLSVETCGPIGFDYEEPGEDLRGGTSGREARPQKGREKVGAVRAFSAERLVGEWRRTANDETPERVWLYLRADANPELESVDLSTDEGKAFALDYALRAFGKPFGTKIELGKSSLSDVPMIAVWNGSRDPTDDDKPEW